MEMHAVVRYWQGPGGYRYAGVAAFLAVYDATARMEEEARANPTARFTVWFCTPDQLAELFERAA